MEIAIIGDGIVGLALALNLHQRGLGCRVYEAVAEVKELGVGTPFDNLDYFISQEELRALSEGYERVAGYGIADLVARASQPNE